MAAWFLGIDDEGAAVASSSVAPSPSLHQPWSESSGATQENELLFESDRNWIILFFESNEIHYEIESKSSEAQLLKSNWIWIFANPFPGLDRANLTSILPRKRNLAYTNIRPGGQRHRRGHQPSRFGPDVLGLGMATGTNPLGFAIPNPCPRI
jgi:hypothetical protein